MAIYENGNNGIGSMRFDDNTILEVKQPGGGGSGVGGAMGLAAVNLITGESTSEVIEAQAEQIEEQGEEIDTLTEQNTELQAENAELTERNTELAEQLENAYTPIASATRLYYIASNTQTADAGRAVFVGVGHPSSAGGFAGGVAVGIIEAVGGTIARTLPIPLYKQSAQNRAAFNVYYPSDATISLGSYFTNCCTLSEISSNIVDYKLAIININDIETYNSIRMNENVFTITAA